MNQHNPDRPQGEDKADDDDDDGRLSSVASPVGGSYGTRHKGGSSGYADVSDYGRRGGHGMRSGIDYGAASNRDNQDLARGFTHDDRLRSAGDRKEDPSRADEGISSSDA